MIARLQGRTAIGRGAVAFVAALLLAGCRGGDAGAQDLLQEGRYGAVIDDLQGSYRSAPSVEAAREIARLLLLVGRTGDAESFLRGALGTFAGNADLNLALGRALLAQGRRDEAAQAFRAASAGGDDGAALLARVHLGEILVDRGRREEALALFDTFIDIYNASTNLDSRQLQAVATAVRHLGILNSALYSDALRAYDEATALDPTNMEAQLEIGTLFLERYNLPEARAGYRQVLDRESMHPLALLGLARASSIEGSPDTGELLERALFINPKLVPALVLRAQLRIAGEDTGGALDDLREALEVNPTSSTALGVMAGIRYLQGDMEAFEETLARALEVNPRNADFFVTMSEILSDGRLYAEAADFSGRGAALDSLAWAAFGTQGLNQLRVGQMAEGRANLERAFAGDPFNVWYKNTLDLLDVIDTFEEYPTENLRVLVDPEDGAALAIYLGELGERAYRDLAVRYGFRPQTPIRIEAFRRSGDFSVRTLGLTGLGALGVSFGPVVALDSPTARSGPVAFNWGSTLWHEISHTFHLGITDHRVPRWLSEGLAVHEETRVAPGWGMRPGIEFFMAYLEDQLRVPSELSLSFSSPQTPDEVGNAYLMGSLILGWIEEERGFDAIRRMLEGYRDHMTPAEVSQQVLGMSVGEFDQRFDRWFRDRFAGPLAAAHAALELREIPAAERASPAWLERRIAESREDIVSRVQLAQLLMEGPNPAGAIPYLEQAREVFPENPLPNGPSRMIATIRREEGNSRAAIEALREYLEIVGSDLEAYQELADLLEETGDLAGAARELENAMYINPFSRPMHERLADLFRRTGNFEGEVRERRVFLALNPPDRAGALFRLAEAQLAAGRREEARASVLGALEIAPRFPEAQDLLLRILEGS